MNNETNETIKENNNNTIREEAIKDFGRLVEAYKTLNMQNQQLKAENEQWKKTVSEFNTSVERYIDNAVTKIISSIKEEFPRNISEDVKKILDTIP